MKSGMQRCFICLALLLGCWLTGSASAGQVQVTDALGNQLTLAQPASRIISLAPYLTENLYALNAGDRLVGTVEYSHYPPEALKLPVIGRYDLLNVEAVLAQRPDLLLAWASGNRQPQLQQLAALGIPVYYSEVRTLAALQQELLNLGSLTGRQADAERLAASIQQARQQYSSSAQQAPLSVFLQVSEQPLMTLNGEHLVNEMLTLCGGLNLFADLSLLAPMISYEGVLLRNPQVILAGTENSQWLAQWQRFPQLQAVEHGALFALDPDLLYQPTPRLVEGIRQLCAHLDQARQSYQAE